MENPFLIMILVAINISLLIISKELHRIADKLWVYDKELIREACKYIRDHKEEIETEDNGIAGWIPDSFIEGFKKYMEDFLHL